MRWLTVVLAVLLLLIQYPLWFGKGGWLNAWEAERRVVMLREANDRLAQRNAALAAEVLDLRQGDDAVAERARAELGMIGPRELFFRVVPQTASQGSPADGVRGEARPAPHTPDSALPTPDPRLPIPDSRRSQP